MDKGFQLICLGEVRRLLLLMGATVALVIVVQYFEFPSTLFSAGNISSFLSGESSTNSDVLGNMTISNGLNSTNIVAHNKTTKRSEASNVKKGTVDGNESKETEGTSENSYVPESYGGSSNTFGLGSNGFKSDDYVEQSKSSTLGNGKISVNSPPAEKAMAPDISFKNVSDDIVSISGKNNSSDAHIKFPPSASPPINALSDNTFPVDTKLSSPVIFVNSDTSSVSKDGTGTLKIDENSELLPSVASKSKAPAVKWKKSKKPPSRVISISQMNDLLHKSRASFHSVVCKDFESKFQCGCKVHKFLVTPLLANVFQRPQWPLKVDQEVLFAKSQIEKPSDLKNDNSLYAPIYRNVSKFKRYAFNSMYGEWSLLF